MRLRFNIATVALALLSTLAALPSAFGNDPQVTGPFELRGRVAAQALDVDSAEPPPELRVTLYSVETSFVVSAVTTRNGNFRFRDLPRGSYIIALLRPGLGEIRRSVVVTEVFADRDMVVETTVPYSAGEAAMNDSAGSISASQLTIPQKAIGKYQEAQQKLTKLEVGEAAAKLREALALAPEFAAAWNALGVIAVESGADADAERYYRMALDAEPGNFEASVNLGALLLQTRRNEEALPLHLDAIRERPLDALANAQLGMNYYRLEQWDRAEQYLNQAKKIDPVHFSQPGLFLADIYARRGEWHAAVRELEELLERRPDGPLEGRIRDSIARLRSEARAR